MWLYLSKTSFEIAANGPEWYSSDARSHLALANAFSGSVCSRLETSSTRTGAIWAGTPLTVSWKEHLTLSLELSASAGRIFPGHALFSSYQVTDFRLHAFMTNEWLTLINFGSLYRKSWVSCWSSRAWRACWRTIVTDPAFGAVKSSFFEIPEKSLVSIGNRTRDPECGRVDSRISKPLHYLSQKERPRNRV